jgi:tRNA U34 5-carboxymethylaminomethyl modifying GTPase MnmE/TrmE
LESAAAALQSALCADAPDILASAVQTALYHIGNVTGTNAAEAVLDKVFSKFCLGK